MAGNQNSLPTHVGIIMDGNGRWAEKQNKKRSFGHKAGAKKVDEIVTCAFNVGVKVLTLYAFSTENWNRPKNEVDELMSLLKAYFNTYLKKIINKGVRLVVIGDRNGLTEEIKQIIEHDEEQTKNNLERVLIIAINYGGRQEIVSATKKLIKEKKEITVENISANLYTAEFGEPDLIIRTGGEKRLSNFLLFQGAYAELYFCDTLWPDFSEEDFDCAIKDYQNRNRRFGRI